MASPGHNEFSCFIYTRASTAWLQYSYWHQSMYVCSVDFKVLNSDIDTRAAGLNLQGWTLIARHSPTWKENLGADTVRSFVITLWVRDRYKQIMIFYKHNSCLIERIINKMCYYNSACIMKITHTKFALMPSLICWNSYNIHSKLMISNRMA